MEPKTGTETSEFKLTNLVVYAGLSLDVLGVLLESLKNAGLEFGWMPAVMAVVGSLMAVIAKLGYVRSRTMLKLQAQQPAAAQEVAELVPLYKGLLAEVKALRSGGMPPSP